VVARQARHGTSPQRPIRYSTPVRAIRAVVPAERTVTFEEFEVPDVVGPHQAIVRIERTIISAGTELANWTGLDPGTRVPGEWNCYPWRPGYGGIGRVLAAGAKSGRREGERVYGIFNHGTHALVDCSGELCEPVPDGLDPSTAVFVRMGNVAITALQRAATAAGDAVAIIGLGVVGNLAGQFFAANGRRVAGIDLSRRRREIALECGFDAVVDPAADELLSDAVKSALGNRPRVVVDAVGDSRVVAAALELVARNGQVLLLGTPRAPWTTDVTPILNLAHRMGVSVIGALEWNIPLLARQGPEPTTEGNARLILRMLAGGRLQTQPLLSKIAAPSELQACYEGLLERRDELLGVVLDWTREAPAPGSIA
jgi:2-desacetyl-2-hydroxyethyl bacteriochlorophyllide A dehydrogenase